MHRRRQKLVILCHDLATVRAITDAAGRYFDLVWARDDKSWFASVVDQIVPSAVLVDNSAAPATAITLLQSVQSAGPSVRRVLITDYCDLGIIVQGLHTGAVQEIVYKPIHASELLAAVGASTLSAHHPSGAFHQQVRATG